MTRRKCTTVNYPTHMWQFYILPIEPNWMNSISFIHSWDRRPISQSPRITHKKRVIRHTPLGGRGKGRPWARQGAISIALIYSTMPNKLSLNPRFSTSSNTIHWHVDDPFTCPPEPHQYIYLTLCVYIHTQYYDPPSLDGLLSLSHSRGQMRATTVGHRTMLLVLDCLITTTSIEHLS